MLSKTTRKRIIPTCVLFLLILLLNACGTTLTAPHQFTELDQTNQLHILQQQKQRQAITHWQLSGAISIHLEKDGASLFLDWLQINAKQAQLRFTGPVNAGSAILRLKPRQATLSTSRGKQYQARSAEALLAREMGWHLPVSHLFYWVRGLTAPDTPSTKRYRIDGTLQSIEQAGWHISYRRFKTLTKSLSLPSKIIFYQAQHHITVKIIVNHWQL